MKETSLMLFIQFSKANILILKTAKGKNVWTQDFLKLGLKPTRQLAEIQVTDF